VAEPAPTAASAIGALDTPVRRSGLPGATPLGRHGPRLGIVTVRDLLTYLPRRYDDLREVHPVAALRALEDGAPATIRARVEGLRVEQTFRRRVQRTIATLRDEAGDEVQAIWFGRRFIERRLGEGTTVIASGKVRQRGWQVVLENPEFQPDDGSQLLHAGRIVPVYRLTRGITSRQLRSAMRAALDRFGPYPEYLPPDVRGRRPDAGAAIEAAHFPPGFDERDAALERLAHDELLALQLGMISRRRQRHHARADAHPISDADERALRAAIGGALSRRLGRGVELTPDQDRAMSDVRADLAADTPMLRLIQGDVGSGKTAVAAYALGVVAGAGGQAALLAPTDLLARQLARTVADMLAETGVAVVLLTGSLSGAARRSVTEALATGQAQVVVGTHALLQPSVAYARLDLVVIDEQHRFGVAQREALAARGRTPHILLMTATPIPRTLGQVFYADLEVSDLRGVLEGRQVVATGIRATDALTGTWERVRSEAEAGQRTFVVVPLIDPDDADAAADGGATGPSLPAPADGSVPAARGAEEVAARLREELHPLRVGLVHGRMRSADREAEMTRFRDGELDVLVGTTVVEVGVDVPEATMMIVLEADRFGLSQLHQLRGRVGRGSAASYCVLVSDAAPDSVARARLEALRETHDGFELAELDWKLRGEGDVLGVTQSGLPRLRVASLRSEDHRDLATGIRDVAMKLLDADGALDARWGALEAELTSGWLARVAAGEGDEDEGVGA
jgi:ATP-dependent DNA helicase RecG